MLQIFTGLPFIGWAKPTPYEPSNFRREVTMRQGHMLVAGAGPVSNLLLAVLFTAIFFVIVRTGIIQDHRNPIVMMVGLGIQMNVVLALFNLVPIPPLDGSKVASYGLPGDPRGALRSRDGAVRLHDPARAVRHRDPVARAGAGDELGDLQPLPPRPG